jgi:hypothetical protein
MKKTFLTAVIVILSVSALAGGAQTTDKFTLDPQPSDVKALSETAASDWRFSFMAYIWIPGFSGEVRSGPQKADDVDNFPFAHFSYAFMGEAELSKGPFSLIFNGMWLGLEADDFGPRNRGDATLDGYIIDLVAGWKVGEWACGKDGKFWLQPLVGFRYYDLDLELDIDDIGDAEVGTDLFDPVVGARLVAECGKHWVFQLRADVGGFGVGTDLSWQLNGSVSYWFNRNFFMTLGYKALGIDLDDDSGNDRITLDGVLHGPYLGVGFAL